MDLHGKLRLLPKLSANHNGKESVIALALYPKGTAAGGKKMKNTNSKLSVLIQLALLTSVILLLAFTPLGYLRIGLLEITFLTIPVIVGACTLGPAAGAFLGAVFGATSFATCFGSSAFGTALLGIQPVLTFLVCVPTRILMGFFSGLLFQFFYRLDKKKIFCYGAACLSGAVLNTVFFMSALVLCFGQTDFIQSIWNELTPGSNVIVFILAFVGVQGAVEALVCGVVGAAISKALSHFRPER